MGSSAQSGPTIFWNASQEFEAFRKLLELRVEVKLTRWGSSLLFRGLSLHLCARVMLGRVLFHGVLLTRIAVRHRLRSIDSTVARRYRRET